MRLPANRQIQPRKHAYLGELAETFGLDAPPERIEIYDNSHIQGAHAIGAMVVAGREGFIKSAYRKFNMKSEGPHAATSW